MDDVYHQHGEPFEYAFQNTNPNINCRSCNRANGDCFDVNNEFHCVKNSVITAAIIGSLICGLLIVIAISCACKLVALRHMEQYRSTLSNNAYATATFPNADFPFSNNPGDLDASLFRLDRSIFLREPPPSYASTMGGYFDYNASNSSYIDQYRRYRHRQRRCRRARRQHRNNPNILPLNGECSSDVLNEIATSSVNIENVHTSGHIDSVVALNEPNLVNGGDSSNIIHKMKKSQFPNELNSGPLSSGCSIPAGAPSSQNIDNLNIELETIPTLTNFDCDSQPLIR